MQACHSPRLHDKLSENRGKLATYLNFDRGKLRGKLPTDQRPHISSLSIPQVLSPNVLHCLFSVVYFFFLCSSCLFSQCSTARVSSRSPSFSIPHVPSLGISPASLQRKAGPGSINIARFQQSDHVFPCPSLQRIDQGRR